jgi:hypothetical protein
MIQKRSGYTMGSATQDGPKMDIGQMPFQKDNKTMGSLARSSLVHIMSANNISDENNRKPAEASHRSCGTENLSNIITQALDLADDDIDVMEKSSSVNATANYEINYKCASERQAEELLQDIVKARGHLAAKDQDLDKCTHQQLELAFARHAMKCDFGTHLTMKKVGRIRQERERVSVAMKLLDAHAAEIVSKLEQARNHVWREGNWQGEWASLDEEAMIVVDLSAQQNFEQEISDLLSLAAR